MDEGQVLEQHDEISEAAGAADAAVGALSQLLARELPLPVRHQLRIALGGVETRAPQYEFRSFTIVNRGTSTLYVAATPGDAERARAGEGGVAVEIPPTSVVTEPLAGRELYVAGTGSGVGVVVLYRWAHVLPPSLYSSGTVSLGSSAELATIAGAVDDVAVPSVMRVSGNVTIPGTVAVTDNGGSLTVDGAVSIAGTANTAVVATLASTPQIDYALIGGTAYAVQRRSVRLTADGELIPAGGVGNKILLHGLALQSAVAQATCEIKDGAAGSVLLYALPGANGGFVLPESPMGWAKGTANTALYLNSFDAAGAVIANLVYTLVP